MTGRERVWTALKRGALQQPPKGEILIEDGWLSTAGFQSLGEAIEYLRADLVVLPCSPDTDWAALSRSDVFLFGGLQGPVTFFTEVWGWPAFSRLLIKQPWEARALMAAFVADLVQAALQALDCGCEGIVILDDLAGDKGPLINPNLLQELYFPVLEQALAKLNNKKVPVIFHSDGNVLRLIPMLKEIGFWGIHGLQPEVGLEPAVIQACNLHHWVYWGNFAFEGAGRLKHVAEIEQGVRELLTKWRDFPGFIFGASGGLYRGLALPEIKAAYDTVENWRR